ncbi:histone-fold-containing protein [Gorgonomyces haynaldii]|nr:histone-fold-containing protein [Gorgonomyces haynaldii]
MTNEEEHDEMVDYSDLRKPVFALAKIKKMMRSDPEMPNVTVDGTYCAALACEMFLELITQEASQYCQQDGRKTISYKDIAQAVHDVHEFEFLLDIVPQTIPYADAVRKKKNQEDIEQAYKELETIS